MRLLLVTQYFWPEGFRINDLMRACAARGAQVDILTGKPNYPGGAVFDGYRAAGMQHEVWEGCQVFRVPLLPRGRAGGLRLALNYLSFIASAALFGPWLLRGRSADVVFVYAPSPLLQALPALLLARLKRAPLALWVQDLWPESLQATGHVRSRWILGAVAAVVRFIYRHTDLILVQSLAFVPPVAALAPGKAIRYYPNSVEALFVQPLPPAPAVAGRFTVLFTGNLGTAQAVEVIAEAAERLRHHPAIHFRLAGDGSRREWLLAAQRERGLDNLELPGRLPLEAMPGEMARASALLVTLAAEPIFALTVPAKVQAYLAAGRPVIASLDGEGARLVQEAQAGFTAPAGDAAALAAAVLRLYALDATERARLGENGRRYFEAHFHPERLTDELMDILRTLARERRP